MLCYVRRGEQVIGLRPCIENYINARPWVFGVTTLDHNFISLNIDSGEIIKPIKVDPMTLAVIVQGLWAVLIAAITGVCMVVDYFVITI